MLPEKDSLPLLLVHHRDSMGVARPWAATMLPLKLYQTLMQKLPHHLHLKLAFYIFGRMVSALRMVHYTDSMMLRTLQISP